MSLVLPFIDWSSFHKGLLWAYRGPVEPKFRKGRMNAYHITLWFLREGSVSVTLPAGKTTAHSGQWMLIPPQVVYQDFSDDAELWSLRFFLNTLGNTCLFKLEEPKVFEDSSRGLHQRTLRLIRTAERVFGPKRNHMAGSVQEASAHLEVEASFLLFLRELLTTAETLSIPLNTIENVDPRVRRCIHKIQNSALSTHTTEADLAQHAGLSISQLNRLFHAALGKSSRAWLEEFRFTQAKALLQTQAPIKEIAYSLGFSSPQHFSSWFKKHAGVTPSGLRNSEFE